MMTKREMINKIVKSTKKTHTSCTKEQVREVLETFAAIVLDELTDGRKVGLLELGNFSMVERKPKMVTNLHTRERFMSKGRLSAKFTPSAKMKAIGVSHD